MKLELASHSRSTRRARVCDAAGSSGRKTMADLPLSRIEASHDRFFAAGGIG